MENDPHTNLTPRERAFLRDNPDVKIAVSQAEDVSSDAVKEKPFNPDLVGIGGWLGLFIGMFAYGGLRTLTETIGVSIKIQNSAGPYFAIIAEEQSFLMKLWALGLFDFALRAFVVFNLLWRKVPRSVSIAIVGVWIAGPVVNILTTLLGGEAPQFYAVLGAALFSAIWTAYFLTSKRVAATYNPSRPEIAEIFK